MLSENRIAARSRMGRRGFLARGLAGTLGLAVSPLIQAQIAASGAAVPKARRCVVLWLNGGPSHIDSFDPKPGAETGGPFKAIDTQVPGLNPAGLSGQARPCPAPRRRPVADLRRGRPRTRL